MDDFFFKSLIMNIAQGLLSSQTDDFKYIDIPGRKKEEILADEAFKYANALMKKFIDIDETSKKAQ